MKHEFNEVLKDLMIETNTTSQKLAKEIGVSDVTVNRWKSGNISDLFLSRLVMLGNYFQCTLDYLIGRTDNHKKPSKTSIGNFGESVRAMMKSKGITTYQIRKQTKFGGNHFHDWDNGADPKLETLLDLANYFNCSLDELVGLE
ncbi:MAG: helix-turn-helix domain-containing protein [Firmicutes bacterium]|nr:helix-turn-helix domain-containing protein [Bacillota bacterium]